MKAITLRNIPSDLASKIHAKSKSTGLSLGRTVICLLEEHFATARRPREYDDLDKLAGTWGKEEADRFDEGLARERRIDPEMWTPCD